MPWSFYLSFICIFHCILTLSPSSYSQILYSPGSYWSSSHWRSAYKFEIIGGQPPIYGDKYILITSVRSGDWNSSRIQDCYSMHFAVFTCLDPIHIVDSKLPSMTLSDFLKIKVQKKNHLTVLDAWKHCYDTTMP